MSGRNAKGEGSIFPRAGGGYRGYVTVKGTRKYFTAKTKAEAGQKRRELLNQRDEGRLATGREWTVAKALTYWLEKSDHRPTTLATHRWIIEQKILPALGSKRLVDLETDDIEEWLDGMKLAPSSQRRYLAPLKTALGMAVARGRMPSNPADRIELAPLKRSHTEAFSRADREAVLAAAEGYNRARWHLALTMGLRPGEALGLTWHDFDETRRTLLVRRELLRATGRGLYLQDQTKTDAGDRAIQLPRSIVEMLVDQRREQLRLMTDVDGWEGWEFEGQPVPLIFTQLNGRPIDAGTDTRAWKRLLAAAGLPSSRRYTARHTAASHLVVDSGGDVAVTAHILGHADAAFTYRTYVHPLAERQADLMAKLDAPYGAPYAPLVEPHEATPDHQRPRNRAESDA